MRDTSAGAGKDDPYKDSPRRYINKREGVRHVLHAAIRAVLSDEDPFAIHLLGQSAEKVLLDLLANEGVEDPLYSLLSGHAVGIFRHLSRILQFSKTC
jgi:hypothetical protein